MVKIEFSEDTTKLNWNDLFRLYEAKLMKASPELYNKHVNHGCTYVMGQITCIIFPADVKKYDHRFLEFSLWSWLNSTTFWFPPHLPDLVYNRYARWIPNCRVFTPKGSDTEEFFKTFTFPKSVENGYPVVEGKQVKPNDCTIIYFNAKVRENESKEEVLQFHLLPWPWKKILTAFLGIIIAFIISAFLLREL